MILALVTFVFLLILIAVKVLTVLELRSLAYKHHRNQNRVMELEADLDTSRRRYLIALKAEGVAKNKVSTLKMRHATSKQHLDQLATTARQQEAQEQREVEGRLEALVMQALGGTSVRRDSHFKKVMSVIRHLPDLDQHSNNEELMTAIQQKLVEIAGKKDSGVPASTAADADQTKAPSAAAPSSASGTGS